jgi:hypothetical protein
LIEAGGEEVAFRGVDEVAEIAYLSLQEAGLRLAAVIDEENERRDLFGQPIIPLDDGVGAGFKPARPIVVTSLKRRDHLQQELACLGVDAAAIHVVGQVA